MNNEELRKGAQMELQADHALTYVNKPQDILQALQNSKETGSVVGIFAISLGPAMIMTAVDEIVDIRNDKLIVLKETDLLGMPIPEEQIFLSEIVRVHAFKTCFNDPAHVQLRSFDSSRDNLGLA